MKKEERRIRKFSLKGVFPRAQSLYKIEFLDVTMYTIADTAIYDDLYGKVLSYELVTTISEGIEVKITGKRAVLQSLNSKPSGGSYDELATSLAQTA